MNNAASADVISAITNLLSPRELIAITGGGGKTTLLYALAKRLRENAAVVTTTTTHICPPDPEENKRLIVGPERWDEWQAALREERHVTIADSAEANGKLRGFSREAVDTFFRDELAPFILVEADGAKRMPFKAYEAHEPVIPPATTLHIVVVGIEPFISPLSEENTFRLHRFTERRGIRPGERLSAETIADILGDTNEYLRGAAASTRRILLVNKCELADECQTRAIKKTLCAHLHAYDRVLFASLQKRILCDDAEIQRGGKGAVSA